MNMNSSSTSINLLPQHCGKMLFAVWSVRSILVLPVSIVVLSLGLQRWRQQQPFQTLSHVEVFTYQLCLMELLWFCGCLCHGFTDNNPSVRKTLGNCTVNVAFYGELLFHMLTCVERYIAVVHPVTYLRLRRTCGVRIRNISIGGVWLLSVGLTSTQVFTDQYSVITMLCVLVCTITVTCFCSLCVLCVLIHPGPGKGGGEKEQVGQSKQRAFNTIAVISSTQWLWFLALLVATATIRSKLLSVGVSCLVGVSVSFFSLPSCLVLPLLYLYRAGLPKRLNRIKQDLTGRLFR